MVFCFILRSMEIEKHDTPQKITTTQQFIQQQQKSSGGNVSEKTPTGKRSSREVLHPRTPSTSASTTGSGNCLSFNMFPTSVVTTPPAKRLQRVRNPFEPVLADRLHLPLIGSPSLFQRPTTPQLSSTQFEWTIEEVSSLKPVNVEAHETQFHDSPDPDYEAKAQSAISSYFKEHQIVPSPVDCPLRKHRIILSEINGNTPISKPGRRIRDCGTQTDLTLPSILPKELEDALLPYFQPHITFDRDDDVDHNLFKDQLDHQRSSNVSSSSVDTKDISLRRKLFDMHNIIVLDDNKTPTGHRNQPPAIKISYSATGTCSNSNSSPLSLRSWQRTAIAGKLSDSMDKSSFGSLSPISASDGMSISPESPSQEGGVGGGSKKVESRMNNFLRDLIEVEQLSPIHPPPQRNNSSKRQKTMKNAVNAVISCESYRSQFNYSDNTIGDASAVAAGDVSRRRVGNSNGGESNDDKFTPERSSSPLRSCVDTNGIATDSFNVKVSRLMVNSSTVKGGASTSTKCSKSYIAGASVNVERFLLDDTDEILDVDEEDMHMSQMSAKSSNCSSSNSDTPRSKRRSASRKNLSHSFSLNWLENEEEEEEEDHLSKNCLPNLEDFIIRDIPSASAPTTYVATSSNIISDKLKADQRPAFYRTDSGFNEMTMNSNSSSQQLPAHHSNEHSCGDAASTASVMDQVEVRMVCCSSTPSKQAQSLGISRLF